jgi:hypothetical protein
MPQTGERNSDHRLIRSGSAYRLLPPQEGNPHDVVWLTRVHSHAVAAFMAAAPATMHQLPALLRPANADGIHDAATPASPVPRLDVDMKRRQAEGTVVSVTAICKRPDPALTKHTAKSLILVISRQAPHSFDSAISERRRSWVPFALTRWFPGSSLPGADSPPTPEVGDYFRFLLHRGILHPQIRTTAGFELSRPLSGGLTHLPPVCVCRDSLAWRRPQDQACSK